MTEQRPTAIRAVLCTRSPGPTWEYGGEHQTSISAPLSRYGRAR